MGADTIDKKVQYIYIVQASREANVCKIGITIDLEQRLKTYNSRTGKSSSNVYHYLFFCEVSDMRQIEKDIGIEFKEDRETDNKEVYFYNSAKFENYVNFIKSHKLFIKEIFVKSEPNPIVKEIIVKRATPTLVERGLTRKDLLQQAQKTKNDEFYTRYEDIEKEIKMYDKSIWKDKVVFCNCDDAVDDDERKTSAFVQYFKNNFTELGIKKLICTHYSGGMDLFTQGAKGYVAYIYIFTDGGLKVEKIPMKDYDGSFEHPISLKILNEEADIVCTNPPFSRSIDYWKVLIESGKKFIIISNIRITIHTKYLPYFMNNQVWAGYDEIH
jgi:predicted GIY-YIG superfamily endonuclease